MASSEMPRTMGRGLSRLESYLPSTRAVTAFGELRRVLDQTPAQRIAQAKVDQAAAWGAIVGGGIGHALNERRPRSFWERNFGSSARRKGEDAQVAEAAAALGGMLFGAVAKATVGKGDTTYRDAVGLLIWQLVNIAGTDDDGVINEYNEALRWRVLDALDLKPQARAQMAASRQPLDYSKLVVPDLEDEVRAAVATYTFHASANAHGERQATRRVVPLFMRLGMGKVAAERFADSARADYLGERDPLTDHYKTLRLAVIGIGRQLFLPHDVIADAAFEVTRYNPYEAARAENRDAALKLVSAASGLAGIASKRRTVSPAMTIAMPAAELLFRAAADTPAIEAAFTALAKDAGVKPATVDSWLAWSRTRS